MLALITLPFAFWGIESYQRGSGTAQDLAEVAGQKITLQEFTQAQRDQQERPALAARPQLRRSAARYAGTTRRTARRTDTTAFARREGSQEQPDVTTLNCVK